MLGLGVVWPHPDVWVETDRCVAWVVLPSRPGTVGGLVLVVGVGVAVGVGVGVGELLGDGEDDGLGVAGGVAGPLGLGVGVQPGEGAVEWPGFGDPGWCPDGCGVGELVRWRWSRLLLAESAPPPVRGPLPSAPVVLPPLPATVLSGLNA